jgi:aspartyl protease family protein
MRRALLWFLLIALSLAVVLMLSGRGGQGTISNLSSNDFASMLVNIGWLVLIGGAVIAIFRDHLMRAIEAAVLWIVIALLLLLGYTYRFQLRDDHVMAELVPGHAAESGHTVALARSQSADFQINTQVNGRSIPMILDTGASAVVLTNEDAKAIGLPVEMIKYTVGIATANGHTKAAEVSLDQVAVGSIVERAVPALIAQPGQLRTSLLGMSFLNRLQSWEVRGDRLVMRGYP